MRYIRILFGLLTLAALVGVFMSAHQTQDCHFVSGLNAVSCDQHGIVSFTLLTFFFACCLLAIPAIAKAVNEKV